MKTTFLYIARHLKERGTLKVGVSYYPFQRAACVSHKEKMPCKIIFLRAYSRRKDAFKAERAVKEALAHRKIKGEWFRANFNDIIWPIRENSRPGEQRCIW